MGPRRWKQLPGRLVHDLRRSAVRNLIAAGVDEKTAMAVTGHVTAQRVRSLPHRVRGGRGGSDGESRSALALSRRSTGASDAEEGLIFLGAV